MTDPGSNRGAREAADDGAASAAAAAGDAVANQGAGRGAEQTARHGPVVLVLLAGVVIGPVRLGGGRLGDHGR